MSWTNDFIGIPYKLHGRERDGLDCWGMVRLVYSELCGITLPSLAEQYENPVDAEGFTQAHALTSPEWREVETPSEGVDVDGCVTRARETRRSRGDVSHRERDGVSRETRWARRWVMTRPRDD